MIAYKDFVPRQIRAPRLSFNPADATGEYETFGAAVDAANRWLKQNDLKVLQMETVVLPNIWATWEQGTQDSSLMTHEGAMWHQFLRVWYELE